METARRMRFPLALAALLGAAPAAMAWTPLRGSDGTPLRWPAEAWPLPLADDTAAWTRAAMTWTQAGAVGFRPVPGAPAAPDGVVAIERVDDGDVWADRVGDPALVAFTLVEHHDGGRLADADVLLNTARFRFAADAAAGGRAYVFEAVLVHELGHVLGLGHSCGAAGGPACDGLPSDDPRRTAVMAPRLEPGAAPRRPGADDRAGLAAVVDGDLPVRRPIFQVTTPLGPGRWAVTVTALRPGDRIRVWREAPVPAAVTIEAGRAEITTDAPPPLDLEIWSAEGQGIFVEGALVAPVGAGATAREAGRPAPADGGCRATPARAPGSAWAWCMWALLVRRRRR